MLDNIIQNANNPMICDKMSKFIIIQFYFIYRHIGI